MLQIKYRRENAGMTQADFAKRLGVSCPTAHAWETGTKLPMANKLPRIARVLNCTIDELFSVGDNTIVPENEV